MVAGHFGLAAIVKARTPATPLWALMLATQWLDVVFVPLFVAGIERIEPVAGTRGGYGEGIIYADYTHSLAGAIALSLIFGAVAAWRWGSRSGSVLGGVAFSHWLIDLVMHRADMPILPANAGGWPRLGFGLWRFPTASIVAELLLVIVGFAMYRGAAVRVAGDVSSTIRTAQLASLIVLTAGLITLAMNVAGY